MKVIELFSGIGSQTAALKRLGIAHEVIGISEIDKYAVRSYEAIHGTANNFGDITKIKELPCCDLLTYSFPCQDISVVGKQAGIKEGTRSGLLFEVERLLEGMEEKPKYLLLENVKNLVGKGHKADFYKWLSRLEELGYKNTWNILNAKDYGIPQNRERVFCVSIRNDIEKEYMFPDKFDSGLRLKDMLENEVDEKYFLKGNYLEWWNKNKEKQLTKKYSSLDNDIAICQTARQYANWNGNYIQCLGMLDIKANEQARRVYDDNGISPTLNTMQGGNRQSKVILEEKGEIVKPRKDIKDVEKYCEFCGNPLERKRFSGRLEDFTVFNNRKYCNRECMSKDYLKIGDNHNQSYSNSHTTARKINELILRKEVCEQCGSEENLDIHHIDENWKNNKLENLVCLCRSCHLKEHRSDKNYRVRKLTPLEVWRLMGFNDDDFNKAKGAGISDSQLYKQAGNSIVVNVLEAIFKNLFTEETNEKI